MDKILAAKLYRLLPDLLNRLAEIARKNHTALLGDDALLCNSGLAVYTALCKPELPVAPACDKIRAWTFRALPLTCSSV
jgi:hypothetical protein